jgi:hypothetical protein
MVPPVPPSTYVSAGKLSLKIILLIVFLLLLTIILALITCYCCCQRQIWRLRAKRIARAKERELSKGERLQNRGLKARIHRGNARFYAPGLYREKSEEEKKRERARGVRVERDGVGKWVSVDLKEVEKPKRAWFAERRR